MKPYYEHAGITIYHGDCREVLNFNKPCDLLLTDPPYGIGFAAQPTDYQRARGMQPMPWDNVVFSEMDLIRKWGEVQIIWGGQYYALPPSRGWLC